MDGAMIALVGDPDARHAAHRAIPMALNLASKSLGVAVDWQWVPTRDLKDPPRDLAGFSGVWLVPASPYESTEGALGAVRWAREHGVPFLGTCGGFQHALLEFARNVAGIVEADHAEMNPTGVDLVLTRLSCSMVEKAGMVSLTESSGLANAYGALTATETYRCNYGFNPRYRIPMEKAGMVFTAFDEAGEVRGAELPCNPFFVGVLFQPERRAFDGVPPPLVLAFVKAAAAMRQGSVDLRKIRGGTAPGIG
jgi:CTP synthase